MRHVGSTFGLFNLSAAAIVGMGVAGTTEAALLGHYAFDGNTNDSATADGAQNLTLSGDAALTSGLVGSGALVVDGTGDYATAASNFTSGAAAVTVTAWFKWTGAAITSSTNGVVVQMPITGGTASQSAAAIEINNGQIQGGARSVSTDAFQGQKVTAITLVTGRTYLAAAVIDYAGDSMETYLYDLAADTWYSSTGAHPFANSTGAGDQGLNIGRRADNQRLFVGVIDDVRVYTEALTLAQVQGLVPEPASMGVLGLLGLSLIGRRSRRGLGD